jgi:hypothetical protein
MNFFYLLVTVGVAFLLLQQNQQHAGGSPGGSATAHWWSLSSSDITEGEVEGRYYRNRALGFALPIPANWVVMSRQELETRAAFGKTLVQQRVSGRDPTLICGLRTQSLSTPGAGIPPSIAVLATPDIGLTPQGYLRVMSGATDLIKKITFHPGPLYTLQCRGRALDGIDFAATGFGKGAYLATYITRQKGNMVMFTISGGDPQTFGWLKQVMMTTEFR